MLPRSVAPATPPSPAGSLQTTVAGVDRGPRPETQTRKRFSISSRRRDLNRLPANVPNRLRIARIVSDHALILPHRTNPCGYDFRERQPIVSINSLSASFSMARMSAPISLSVPTVTPACSGGIRLRRFAHSSEAPLNWRWIEERRKGINGRTIYCNLFSVDIYVNGRTFKLHTDCYSLLPCYRSARPTLLQIIIFGLQRAAGPYRWATNTGCLDWRVIAFFVPSKLRSAPCLPAGIGSQCGLLFHIGE